MSARRIVLSVGLLVGAVLPRAFVAETVEKLPAPTAYVSDFAGVIDAASKQQIEALCVQVNNQAHAQIAVVTIHSLEGVEASEFANKLVEKWKVGTSATDPHGRDRGVLLLFAIDDRKRWIEVGYGLEGVLNDAKVGDIGRSMKPQLAAGAYGPAIQGGVVQIANAIAADAGVTLTQPQQVHTYHYQQQSSGIGIGSILKILIFLAIVVFIIGRGGGGGGLLWFLAGSMMGGGGRDGDSGFGGGGGGGDSGGGGFGGFDGGGSGGGGAGGDW